MLIKKQSKLYGILYLKCPRCHEGDLFSSRNPYDVRSMLDMAPRCPICGQDFIMEPGFYTGALWTSYPLAVATFAICWAILDNVFGLSSSTTLLAGSLAALALQPPIMRMGRAIWISVFVAYRGSGE
jgi:hypothetical protein